MIPMERRFKKKTNWGTLIMLCVYELFVVFFIFIWTYAAIVEIIHDGETSEFLTISIMLLLLGLFILDLILWQIRGYEFVRMDNGTLTIRKKGKLFSISNTIDLSEIENIYLKNYNTTFYTLFVKIMGIKGGKICIEYLGRSIYVGQSLTDEEASKYIGEMNKLLSDYRKERLSL